MALIDYLLGKNKKTSASQAKDRLQILLAHERSQAKTPAYLPKMREEILQVIAKYIDINEADFQISLDEEQGFEVLELNVVLPDTRS